MATVYNNFLCHLIKPKDEIIRAQATAWLKANQHAITAGEPLWLLTSIVYLLLAIVPSPCHYTAPVINESHKQPWLVIEDDS